MSQRGVIVLRAISAKSTVAALMILIAVSNVAAAPAPSQPPTIVGFWYGIGEPGDPDTFYVDAFHPDGKFNGMYAKCEKGKLINQQTQAGTWKLEDGVLTINSTVIDGKPGKFDHSYDVELLTATEFHARLQDIDFLFIERRIPKFEFPPCYLGV